MKLKNVALVAGCVNAIAAEKYLKLDFEKHRADIDEELPLAHSAARQLRKRASDDSVAFPLVAQENYYSINLEVGTPPQNVSLLLDTGSSDMWVIGSNNGYCKNSDNKSRNLDALGSNRFAKRASSVASASPSSATDSDGGDDGDDSGDAEQFYPTAASEIPAAAKTLDCQSLSLFDLEKSSSFKSNSTPFFTSYGDNSYASGLWGTDDVRLGNLSIADVFFAVANFSNSSTGVLGVGLPALESYNPALSDNFNVSDYLPANSSDADIDNISKPTYANFPQILKQKNVIEKVAYSLFLNDTNATNGQILFGAVDHSKYTGSLSTLPLVNSLYVEGINDTTQLEITLDGMGLKNSQGQFTIYNQKMPALLDSGTTVSYLPIDLHSLVAKQLKGTVDPQTGFIKLKNCPAKNDNTQLVFNFGGAFISIKYNEFIEKSDDDNCYVTFMPQAEPGILLGDNFLRNAYIVYDLEDMEISIAQANFNGGAENIEAIVKNVPSAVKAPGYSASFTEFPSSYATTGNIFSGYNSTNSTGSAGSKTTMTSSRTSRNTNTASAAGNSSSSTRAKKNAGFAHEVPVSAISVIMVFNILLSMLL
ncbi:related to Aspartic proteinase 3 [Nakaseomyces glabratus]|nr:Eukaryotic and viral aspartyl proteases active site [Nakaseomyces glabratus]QNG13100.1 YPS2 [Nakaseomyces glabratus]SCV15154.1 related to Aspartic proteinase 3 [Nakaseomyces glabratus]SLM14216.1 related to Aspartic proteinase 3 [Nakaseomyces glabratus]